MRKLASIKKIVEIKPIEGADLICAYRVDGWWVVDSINKYQVDDLVVYFEIDSVLPIREEFEFLRKSSYVKKDWLVTEVNPSGEGFRLKTIKLRGQVSQGLIVPVNVFLFKALPEEGQCVTDSVGVVKWDPPIPANMAGKVKGNFPSFIRKTDQERIQNLKDSDFEPYRNDTFEATLKLDGSSMTVYHYNGSVGVCSRNLELDVENDRETTFGRVFYRLKLDEILPEIGNYAIQGELMGPGIQGNREKLKDHCFFVFDIYDIDRGCYLNYEDRHRLVEEIVEKQLSLGLLSYEELLKHCPVIDDKFFAGLMSCDELLMIAEGPSMNQPIREGLVFKSKENPHFSFKAISNKFLLKGGE